MLTLPNYIMSSYRNTKKSHPEVKKSLGNGDDVFKPALSISHEALLIDGNDEKFRRVLFLTRLFADRLALFLEVVGREIGLTGNQYAILLGISHTQGNGGATVREIAHYALMASTHVTTQVGALVRKGLVVKKPNGKDGRSVLLLLTKKGEEAMTTIAPIRQQFNDAFFVDVSKSSLLAAEKFLQKVTENSDVALPLIQNPDLQINKNRSVEK